MHTARRRHRALRSRVLAASVAVLATVVVGPVASAGATDTPSGAAVETSEAPADPSSAVPTGETPPVEASATDVPAPSAPPAPTASAPASEEPAPPVTTADPTPVDAGDTVVGELVQAWPDPTAEEAQAHDHERADEGDDEGGHADHADEGPLSWIQPRDGDAVRVPTEDLPAATVGSTVAVTVGDELTDEASAEQGLQEAREVLDAAVLQAAAPDPTVAAAGAAPTHTVTVVLVRPAGGAIDGTTTDSLLAQVDGPVADFWSSQSAGAIRIDAVAPVTGWVTSSRTCREPHALWGDVANQIGWTWRGGQHLMLYIAPSPSNPGCSYGLGTVGSSTGSGGQTYVQAVGLSVMAHELGHNFGLGHSSAHQCDGVLEGGTCQTRSYYDLYDVMGISWGQVGSLNAVQAARLGLLPAAQRVAFTPSSPATTVTLAPVSATSGTRAVQLTASNGTVYWLEYRQASGRDAWLGNRDNQYGLNSGVVLRRASGGSDTSLLLDGTPSRANGWGGDLQTALPVGRTTTVAGGDFGVLVQSTSSGGAVVRLGGSTPVNQVSSGLPRGNWDSVSVTGPAITVTGWALDPDRSSVPSQVHVYVDGVGRAVTADLSRADVGAAFPDAGSAHGFSVAVQAAPGLHTVCVYAIDLEDTSGNTPLGCRAVSTQAALPVGNWEAVSTSGGDVAVTGWALDPDQPTTPSAVHVYVDGGGRAVTADGSRPDVGNAFPGAGPAHGFRSVASVAPGVHTVCAYAIDLDIPARNVPLGCRVVTTQITAPTGNWESAATAADEITLSGWTFDPDAVSRSIQVHAYVDGSPVVVTADGSRTDVGAAFPGAGNAHGFTATTRVSPGVHTVCVYAIDLDTDWRNTSLGCRAVATQVSPPTGNWETLTASGPTVSIAGWAVDPDAPAISGQVHVYVDGVGHALTADRSRPDVARAFPGAGPAHGFTWSAELTAGAHTVCVYAIDLDTSWRHTSLGCRQVTI